MRTIMKVKKEGVVHKGIKLYFIYGVRVVLLTKVKLE